MLSSHSIDRILSAGSLGEITAEVHRLEGLDPDIPAVTVHIVRNYTVEPLVPFLKLQFYKRGLAAKISIGDYDVLEQAFLSSDQHARAANADIVILSLYLDIFDVRSREIFWQSAEAASRLTKLFDLAREKCRGVILVNTFLRPQYSDAGIASSMLESSRAHQTDELNRAAEGYVAANSSRFFLADWNLLATRSGATESYDARFWFASKSPFKKGFLSAYASEAAKVAAALKGRSKKVLVLDGDNTLWGGVVGEDGVSGIKLDPHEYPGNAFYSFQRNVLNLMERGVMVALNSKNNEADVFEVLDKHPHCLLKRDHLAAWKINWSDKVSNLKELAEELNVGIDSLVFVDDSPMECDLVRQYLPAVHVIQVPARVYDFPDIILADGWFDTLSFSAEDKVRTSMYRQQALRKQDAAEFESIEDYLESLQMVAAIHRVRPDEIGRVAQLTQKTNQFNLTTLRLSEDEVRKRAQNDDCAVFTMWVRDRFGDSGLTAALFVRKADNRMVIENFLMSCRILGRNLEYRFIDHCLASLSLRWELKEIEASYIATAKNAQVAKFWDNVGFKCAAVADSNRYFARCDELCIPSTSYIQVTEG